MHKILHIITRMDMGGSAQNTLLTCIGLSEKYKTILAYGASRESQITALERERLDEKIHVAMEKGVKAEVISTLVRNINPLFDICAFFDLWRFISVEKPHIVHTHSSKAGILGRLAAKIAGIPVIIHSPHGHVFSGHFNALASNVFLLLEKLFDRITDCQISLTEGEKLDYIKLSVSKENKITVIHSGVDVKLFSNHHIDIKGKKNAVGMKHDNLIVGTVGWLLPIKGPGVLLDAMRDVWHGPSDTQLVYVGKGSFEETLKAKASEAGASAKVHFLGWRDDVHEIMQLFDVFVLPSLNEGMGRVLVEAMAAGKPIVASNVGGIPDLVKDGVNGLLVKPGNVKELSQGIKKLLASKEMRQKMGEKGREMSHSFSIEKMLDKLDKLYSSFLSE